MPPGLRLPPGHDRPRRPRRPPQRQPRPRHPPGRRGGRRHLHGVLRPLQGLGTLRPPPPAPPQPPRRGHPLRQPPPDLRGPRHHARLRQRLHPSPRRYRLQLARRRGLRVPAVPDPAPGPDSPPAPEHDSRRDASPPGLLRDHGRGRLHPAQSPAPLRHGDPGPHRDEGPPGGGGGDQRGTRPPGAGDARLGGEDPPRRGPGGGRPGDIGGRPHPGPGPARTTGGAGGPSGPQSGNRVPRTPDGSAPGPDPRHGRTRRTGHPHKELQRPYDPPGDLSGPHPSPPRARRPAPRGPPTPHHHRGGDGERPPARRGHTHRRHRGRGRRPRTAQHQRPGRRPRPPPDTTLDELRRSGHFGLVGMVERAESVGARIHIGEGADAKGTEVLLELPLSLPRADR